MNVLVTGAAGFIGFHTAKALLSRGDTVVGLDNLNDYYAVELKLARLKELEPHSKFTFVKMDLAERLDLESLFSTYSFDAVINLAAQAGVRYSLENPHAYIQSNILGFTNVLECCRHNEIGHLVYASSSSVYGMNSKMPFSESDNVDHPISLYAATKKANELIAHTYSHLYNIPTTGLRFFTVYGPWGRPDMAPFLFTDAILNDRPIKIFNHGNMSRDFTYIDDIVEGVVRILDKPARPNAQWSGADPDPATSSAPYRLYNIGGNTPEKLLDFVSALEKAIGKKSKRELLPIQPGDVESTYANIDKMASAVQFAPTLSVEEGTKRFVDWYLKYHGK